jgi:hypothetical protein
MKEVKWQSHIPWSLSPRRTSVEGDCDIKKGAKGIGLLKQRFAHGHGQPLGPPSSVSESSSLGRTF